LVLTREGAALKRKRVSSERLISEEVQAGHMISAMLLYIDA
jgi:hypothetical protein